MLSDVDAWNDIQAAARPLALVVVVLNNSPELSRLSEGDLAIRVTFFSRTSEEELSERKELGARYLFVKLTTSSATTPCFCCFM